MAKQLKSFSITIVCCMHDWGNILPAVIIPFLETHTKENTYHSYYLTLNCAGGEHIRVVVLTDVEELGTIMTGAKAWLTDSFLRQNDLKERPVIHVQDNERFINEHHQMATADNFYCNSSRILLMALSGMDVTDETLLTYAYYLHIAMIGILAARFNKEPQFFFQIYDPASQSLHPDTSLSNDQIVSKFEENDAFVIETAAILLSITRAGEQQDEVPDFIREWIKAVSNEIIKALPSDNSYLPHTLHRYFALSINRQLGITNNMKAFLYYFIYRGVREAHDATNTVINS
jgi:hypothetical protein